MAAMDSTVEHRLSQIAESQHGVFTLDDALASGWSPDQVRRRVRAGRWERLVPGVFRIRGVPDSWQQRARAATLARPESRVSHLTGAAAHGLSVPIPPRPSIAVARGSSARTAIARVHRVLEPNEPAVVRQGLPVTTVARTIVDCADVLGPARLGRLADEALDLGLVRLAQIAALVSANAISRRQRVLDRLMDHLEVWDDPIRPGSVAEARLLRQLRDWGLPAPDRQIRIAHPSGEVLARVDAGWQSARLGLAYDSMRWHGPARWASDDARHAMVEALGWRLVHVDAGDLRPGRTRLRDLLHRLLADRLPRP